MSVENLCNTLQDGLAKFNAKVEEATAFFDSSLKEGHEAVDMVVDHGRNLNANVGKLRAALGLLTNSGPQT